MHLKIAHPAISWPELYRGRDSARWYSFMWRHVGPFHGGATVFIAPRRGFTMQILCNSHTLFLLAW